MAMRTAIGVKLETTRTNVTADVAAITHGHSLDLLSSWDWLERIFELLPNHWTDFRVVFATACTC
jgi:hypothetical protein